MAYEVNKNTIIGDILDQDFDAKHLFSLKWECIA